ncbi:hypothetical protein SeMB42_g07303 [Synchytrium endobioticum]|uniref:Carboxylesterase type B domain-containing protein n=1 Tax=Synchytrium endobioticum TaxID=286115 RepID=A0A507C545_9FUNG|nr:hypothetical protein SeMB42_g07303 [Synchytrium endobioticum]TPX39669.1 hypothetical protein SeLEV6574_g07060 [Synchytrium endobioticum]
MHLTTLLAKLILVRSLGYASAGTPAASLPTVDASTAAPETAPSPIPGNSSDHPVSGNLTINGAIATASLDYVTLLGAVSDGIVSFKGIRYAEAPTGAHRFAPPMDPTSESAPVNATEFGNVCPQISATGINGSVSIGDEDCLFLNIYAPVNASGLPVMLWIHAGDGTHPTAASHDLTASTPGTSGSGNSFDGAAFISAGTAPLVVVTINYRLGALGWLSGPSLALMNATNLGLLDQRHAMQWVQTHIAVFGGDASKVTLVGHEHAAVAVGYHLVSPYPKLFAAAVLESGGPTTAKVVSAASPAAKDQYDSFLNATECRYHRTASFQIHCLRSLPLAALVQAQQAIQPTAPFYASIDGTFLATAPSTALAAPEAPVPLLIGTTASAVSAPDLPALFATMASNNTELAAELATMYPAAPYGNSYIASPDTAAQAAHTDLMSLCPAIALSRAYAAAGANVYRYLVVRALDLSGIWNPAESTSGTLATTIATYWMNFARDGNPDGVNGTVWPAYGKTGYGPVLVLDAAKNSSGYWYDDDKDVYCGLMERVRDN